MIRRTTMALLLALALVATACASGGTPQAEGPAVMALTPTTVAPSVASDGDASDATSEGIRVHGHWTIEVRNADGSIADSMVFENALQPDGSDWLARVMGGESSLVAGDPWLVALNTTSCDTSGGQYWVPTISLSVADGVFTIESGGELSVPFGNPIATAVTIQSASTLAATPPLNPLPDFVHFTCKDIGSIDVAPNQSVYVTVDISFS